MTTLPNAQEWITTLLGVRLDPRHNTKLEYKGVSSEKQQLLPDLYYVGLWSLADKNFANGCWSVKSVNIKSHKKCSEQLQMFSNNSQFTFFSTAAYCHHFSVSRNASNGMLFRSSSLPGMRAQIYKHRKRQSSEYNIMLVLTS